MAVIVREKSNGAPRSCRMTQSEQFGAVLSLPSDQLIKCHSVWFSVSAGPNHEDKVRFGLTVGKRNAPTAVERNLVKRILREHFRTRANEIVHVMNRESYGGLDISIRLKRRVPEDETTKAEFRRQLHTDAEALLTAFTRALEEKSKRHKMS